ISDPPKPRLITRLPGRSSGKVFQRRKEELPMNRMPSRGGALVRSLASNARISGSQREELVWVCAAALSRKTNSSRTAAPDFCLGRALNMNWSLQCLGPEGKAHDGWQCSARVLECASALPLWLSLES